MTVTFFLGTKMARMRDRLLIQIHESVKKCREEVEGVELGCGGGRHWIFEMIFSYCLPPVFSSAPSIQIPVLNFTIFHDNLKFQHSFQTPLRAWNPSAPHRPPSVYLRILDEILEGEYCYGPVHST